MWRAVPSGWLARSYRVTDSSVAVASMRFAWSGGGAIETPTSRLSVQRVGLFRPSYILRGGELRKIEAHPSGAFRRGFLISCEHKEYRLAPASLLGRSFTLFRRSQPQGEIRAGGFLSRSARANLRMELPLELRLFSVWLVIQAWRRAAAAS